MSFRTLISTAALAPHLDDPAYAIVDCRFKLDDPAWGEREYQAAHVPRASYAHLDRDLSGQKTGRNGRHPLPDATRLAETFGRLGIRSGVQVVAYDQDNGMFASRLWWLLRWLGHDAVAVLDGGFAQWQAENRPTRAGIEHAEHASFNGTPRAGMIVEGDEVATIVRERNARLVDARAPQRFRGEIEPLDPVAGHIPGATNYFFQQNVDQRNRFLPPDQLRDRFNGALAGASPSDVVCYCGSGVTACHNLLALEHAGLTGAKLYPGSWSEWCANEANPIERG